MEPKEGKTYLKEDGLKEVKSVEREGRKKRRTERNVCTGERRGLIMIFGRIDII